MWPRTDCCSHCYKNVATCGSGHLWMWFEWSDLKCLLNASWVRSHLYLRLSTCDRITQDGLKNQVGAAPWISKCLSLSIYVSPASPKGFYEPSSSDERESCSTSNIIYGTTASFLVIKEGAYKDTFVITGKTHRTTFCLIPAQISFLLCCSLPNLASAV